MVAAARATGLVRPPSPPEAELTPRGRFHSRERDARAVRHHYDVPTEFFRLFLGPSMTYSCAIFSRGATTLDEAQEAKHELICQKLGLERGQRVLDVGSGWGGSPSMRPSATACTSPASRCRRRRSSARAGSPRRRASATSSTSACPTTATSRARPMTRSPRSGWSSTSAPSRWTSTGGGCAARCAPAGRCSCTASRTCSRRTRARAPSPRATSSPTARPSRSRGWCSGSSGPASRRTTSRASATTTPRRCGGGRARSTTTSTRRSGSRARARPRVAAVPAGGPQRLRDGLHVGLPDPRVVIGEAVVRVHRGSAVESEHHVAWARGRRGGPGPSVFVRSAAKPFQALAAVRAGVPERLGLGADHLAIACASHGGSDAHVAAGAGAAARGGLRGARPRLRPGRPARPDRRRGLPRRRRPPRAGAPQLLGQARAGDRAGGRGGLAGRGLLRRRPPGAEGDAARPRRGHGPRAGELVPTPSTAAGCRPSPCRWRGWRTRSGGSRAAASVRRRPARGGDDRHPDSSPSTARSTRS